MPRAVAPPFFAIDLPVGWVLTQQGGQVEIRWPGGVLAVLASHVPGGTATRDLVRMVLEELGAEAALSEVLLGAFEGFAFEVEELRMWFVRREDVVLGCTLIPQGREAPEVDGVLATLQGFPPEPEPELPPDHLAELTAGQRGRLVKLMEEALRKRGVTATLRGDHFDTSVGLRIGLHDLAATCRHEWWEKWAGMVDRFVDTALGTLEKRVDRFEEVNARLMVRLYTERDGIDWDEVVWREDLPGVRTVLVVDEDERTRVVRRESALSWERPDEELFALALANLEAMPRLVSDVEGTRMHSLQGQRHAAASVLLIPRVDGWLGRHGTLAIVPARDYMFWTPLSEGEDFAILRDLFFMASQVIKNEPAPISSSVFWYADGDFDEMRGDLIDGRLYVGLSDRFLALQRALGLG